MHFTHPVTLSVLPTLRAGGIKVRIRHKRYVYCAGSRETIAGPIPYGRRWESSSGDVAYPKGGNTTVELTFPDGGFYTGTSVCSLKDRFDRRVGIAVALARALTAREVHTLISP